MVGTLEELPTQVERKVGMTSNQHGPYVRGYTRATMAHTEGSDPVNTFPGLVHTARQAMEDGGT